MRIQHNIMAMNAYRNYTNNTKALSKNLEKLSSGYKINRAGDDAAGLAISEKMRAQITGLKTAQKNAKDGISLVQTAEGALTEVHSMLNRMVELADQSANGTYDDAVDRANLQKEFDALRTEIDRIADSANFNGIKLLDGSLSTTGKTSSAVSGSFDAIKGALAANIKDVSATKSKSAVNLGQITGTTAWATGDKVTLELGMSDGTTHTIELTADVDGTSGVTNLVGADGEVYGTIAAAGGGGAANRADADIQAALKKAVEGSELGETYNVTVAGNKMTLEAKNGGAGVANITSVGMTMIEADGTTSFADATAAKAASVSHAAGDTVVGEDAYQVLDLTNAPKFDGSTTGANSLEKAAFEINGEKFVFVDSTAMADASKKDKILAALAEAGITHYAVGTTAGITTAEVTDMANKIQMATGLKVTKGTYTAGTTSFAEAAAGMSIKLGDGAASKANGGLTLQIGDTSEEFNQLTVSVADMHAKALGISGISIADQANAQSAVETLKEAINSVSSTRGGLGALQNRLEHTINNLSVMQENIQDAEATIRDVDVAEEMMAYTKNTILVQSAQAMLAQANQVPQGVLQLLQ